MIRVLIFVGQIGRIWAKSHKHRQLFQTLTAVGIASLFLNQDRKKKQNYQNEDYDSN